MSILDEVNDWRRRGRLYLFEPRLTGTPKRRSMYLASEINALLDGPWVDSGQEMRSGRLRADLDMFVAGYLISVQREPFRNKTAYMSQLDPASEEVWEIRSRDPKPGIRIFGRFAHTDVFVALTWSERARLRGPGSREWRDAKEQCKTEWRKLFPAYRPFKGNDIHDYISENVFLV
jgi:hypothetical protein